VVKMPTNEPKADPMSVLYRLAEYHADTAARTGGDYIGVEVHCRCACSCDFPLRQPDELRDNRCSECAVGRCKED